MWLGQTRSRPELDNTNQQLLFIYFLSLWHLLHLHLHFLFTASQHRVLTKSKNVFPQTYCLCCQFVWQTDLYQQCGLWSTIHQTVITLSLGHTGAATTAMNNQQCIMYTMRLYIQTLCLYCQFFPKIFFEFSSILCEFLIKTCRQVAQCMRNIGQWNENIVTISHCKELSHIVSAWDMTWLKIRLSYQSTKYFNIILLFWRTYRQISSFDL